MPDFMALLHYNVESLAVKVARTTFYSDQANQSDIYCSFYSCIIVACIVHVHGLLTVYTYKVYQRILDQSETWILLCSTISM